MAQRSRVVELLFKAHQSPLQRRGGGGGGGGGGGATSTTKTLQTSRKHGLKRIYSERFTKITTFEEVTENRVTVTGLQLATEIASMRKVYRNDRHNLTLFRPLGRHMMPLAKTFPAA